tara:strand:+ start:189 stop:632 length:444 start_codon:yes stop_codon:yes gene_type:complete
MNDLKFSNSFKKINDIELEIELKKNKNNLQIINLKKLNKLINYLNILFILLIFVLYTIALNSQRKWTDFYSSMVFLRNNNNNIIDYIAKTEQYLLKEYELKDNIKSANPDDLIYLSKTKNKDNSNLVFSSLKKISNGLNDGIYQRGY